jgi:hypothetical protein
MFSSSVLYENIVKVQITGDFENCILLEHASFEEKYDEFDMHRFNSTVLNKCTVFWEVTERVIS